MTLTLQFVPYSEIENLGPARRVNKLIEIVKQEKIVLLEGRLKKEEEADLIAITMEEIGDKFRGIELAVINPPKNEGFFAGVKSGMLNALLGDRQGFTVVGPASVVKQIKQDPNKIELFTQDAEITKKKRKKK
ncbi:MAG: DUF2073 domain-containing protein [Nanoarchaeota archaeon]|nr:DUF2073 domain-containing protein [Nanoarchaeota archaeon]